MFIQLHSKEELAPFLDDIIKGARRVVKKTGEGHGQSAEAIVKTILYHVERDTGFILIHTDNERKLDGFLIAIFVNGHAPIVEFVTLWTRPRVATFFKDEGNRLFEEWARSKGATKIIAGLIRSPEKFFKWFHEPIGYKNVGIIIVKDLLPQEGV